MIIITSYLYVYFGHGRGNSEHRTTGVQRCVRGSESSRSRRRTTQCLPLYTHASTIRNTTGMHGTDCLTEFSQSFMYGTECLVFGSFVVHEAQKKLRGRADEDGIP